MSAIEEKQQEICSEFSAAYQVCDLNLKVGIMRSLKDGVQPVHGLRVKEENGASGWYIWVGDWSDEPDFFVPLHGFHLSEWASIVMPYLGLPEGWRFLLADDYEDVWEDSSLLMK